MGLPYGLMAGPSVFRPSLNSMTQTALISSLQPEENVLSLVRLEHARRYRSIPLRREGSFLTVAMTNPSDLVAIDDLEFLTGLRIRAVPSSAEAIDRAIEANYRSRQLPVTREPAAPTPPASPIVRIQQTLFEEAIRFGASDVHIDPGFGPTRVRYRVDGLLHDTFALPGWIHSRLAARIKIMARMDISERRLPQDGQLAFGVEGVEARVSTMPTVRGEAIVVRLLNDRASVPKLDTLGGGPGVPDRLRAMSRRPQGIILVAGPTGSGKTTTLYALLEELRRRPLNIVTIEDPVEYRMDGIRQVRVHDRSRLTFGVALRSALRQDPDVILVGEIRDRETANIAFEAALTGHLVLSTLHSTDAVSTLLRLEELGIDRHLTASSLIGVVAQRLVPTNCAECARPDFPAPFYMDRLGIRGSDRDLLRRGYGCAACRFTGTRGRRPLFEILELDRGVRELIVAGREGEVSMRATGFTPLVGQAVERALAGEVALEEAYRTCYFGDAR